MAKRATGKTQPEVMLEEAAEGWGEGSTGPGRATSSKKGRSVAELVCLICNETPKAGRCGITGTRARDSGVRVLRVRGFEVLAGMACGSSRD